MKIDKIELAMEKASHSTLKSARTGWIPALLLESYQTTGYVLG
jgi:hypothetical protein